MHAEDFDVNRYWEVLKKHRKMVWGSFGAAIAVALLVNVLTPPQYESNTSVRVKYLRGLNDISGAPMSPEVMRLELNTYPEIVKSRTVINTVIDRLYAGKEKRPKYEDVANLISTQYVRNSGILAISTLAGSPEEAQSTASTLLEVFNEKIVEIARSEGRGTRNIIGQHLAEAKINLAKAEKEMVEYKIGKRTVSVNDQTRNVVDRQSELKKMQIENQVRMESAQARQASINSQLAQINPGFLGDSQLIQQYKSRLADQEVELVGLRKSYTDNHPKVKSLQAAIDDTRSKLAAEITRVVNMEAPTSNSVHQALLQNKIQTAVDIAVDQAQSNVLARVNSDFDKELTTLPEKEQGLARLTREYTVAVDTYTMLAKRYEQARIDEVMEPTNVQVVDLANLSDQPVRPRKMLNLSVAALIGLLIGAAAAFFTEHFFKTIDTIEDVRRCLGIEVIGCIPGHNPDQEQAAAAGNNVLSSLKSRGA